MSTKISAIDSEWIFTQDIGRQILFEAPRSSKLRPSEGNSLFAAIGFRALKEGAPAIRLSKSSYLNACYDPLSIVFKSGTVVNRW